MDDDDDDWWGSGGGSPGDVMSLLSVIMSYVKQVSFKPRLKSASDGFSSTVLESVSQMAETTSGEVSSCGRLSR